MEDKLNRLYNECRIELNKIGININSSEIGGIQIKIATRKTKRYGCCRQEEPDKTSRYIENHRVKYGKFKKHTIEISKWVMELNDNIIKNTIMHEIIHCMPFCNNHGSEFKKYAKYINEKLGYDISRVGNRAEDSKKSNVKYKEEIKLNYEIHCINCGQTFYRQRIAKNFTRKYRCGNCNGKFVIKEIKNKNSMNNLYVNS